MPLGITALYAVLLTLIGSYLSFRVGARRGQTGISILYGDDMQLAVEMRRHANFVEYVPHALILMVMVELNGIGAWVLHLSGVLLVLSRIAHPIGLHAEKMTHPLRAAGAGGTLLAMLVLVVALVYQLV